MPTSLPKPPPEPEPSRFRLFMASTPAWFQWLTLASFYAAGIAAVVLYLYSVKTDPMMASYVW